MNQLFALCVIPLTLCLISLILPKPKLTRLLVSIGHWLQLLVVVNLSVPLLSGAKDQIFLGSEFSLDAIGAAFVLLTTFVVACASMHLNYFFAVEKDNSAESGHERLFYFCVNALLLSMTFIFLCDNLGFLWISLEATTLSSAPLVYFERTKNALEATWKYVIICSVGIAFALLGTVFIYAAGQHGLDGGGSLSISTLIRNARDLNFPLLRLGFIFAVLGYGTKAGIFPLHSWLPDAYSEAPAPVSAILSGALSNCALYGIFRVSQIMIAAGHANLTSQMLITLGTLTVAAGSCFLIHQHSFKRMWAYSSIENAGLMLIAIGLDSGSLFLLQAVNHSVAKVALFLLSGNIVQAVGSKKLSELKGLFKASPVCALLLALSSMAITGVPPFGIFISELSILTASAQVGNWVCVTVLVLSITVAFVAISTHVGRILVGSSKHRFTLSPAAGIVPTVLILSSFVLGVMFRLEAWVVLK